MTRLHAVPKQWPFPSSDPRFAPEPTPQPKTCRADGRCQYAIDHGAEGMGHCPEGKCCMPDYMGLDLCECSLGLLSDEEARTNRCTRCGKEIFS